jgi:hypothetical protein
MDGLSAAKSSVRQSEIGGWPLRPVAFIFQLANSGAQPMKNFSPWQQISIACAILAILFYFPLQIPWVAALFG